MKKTNKNTNMGMALGMCMGLSMGTALGSLFHNLALGTSMGMCIGMVIGLVLGKKKDETVNQQIEEKQYTIKEIKKSEEKEDYTITLVDKCGVESVVIVPKGQVEAESFAIDDVVYLDEDGMIEQAYDTDDES